MRAQGLNISGPLHMTIIIEPEIPKEIRTLLTKGIAGQLGKTNAIGMVICFMCPGFQCFSISERTSESSFN
jgi:hypothetical protein